MLKGVRVVHTKARLTPKTAQKLTGKNIKNPFNPVSIGSPIHGNCIDWITSAVRKLHRVRPLILFEELHVGLTDCSFVG